MATVTAKGMEKAIGNLASKSKQTMTFANKMSTSGGVETLVSAWGDVCKNNPFPCSETITHFVDNFDNLCGVM